MLGLKRDPNLENYPDEEMPVQGHTRKTPATQSVPGLGACGTSQRTQYSLIKEYTLNHNNRAPII